MSSNLFYSLGCSYMNHNQKNSAKVGVRRFKSFFGVSQNVCAELWNLLRYDMPNESKPKHLLWCLFFLKQYTVEHVRKSIFK